jgi:drug/metabolite transporter (DMT)-like permease
MGSTDARRRPAVWAALVAVYLIWGSTYLGIEVASRTFPPLLMLSLRFLLAGGLLYVLAIGRGERLADRPRGVHWRSALVIGGALLLFGNGGVGLAVQSVDTGIVALIVGSTPLWFALLDRVINGVRLAPAAIVGLVVGFVGVALLVADTSGGRDQLGGAAITLVASIAWAAGSLYSRSAPLPKRPLVASAMEMLAGGLLLGLAGIGLGEVGDVDAATISSQSVLAFAYIVLIGSLVGFSAYTWLLGQAPLSLVGTYAYVNPVVAVLLGVTLLGEPLGWRLFVAGGAIVVAVGLIVGARPQGSAGRPLPSTGDPLPAPASAASIRRGTA